MKKWMTVLDDEQFQWVKQTAKEISTNGSTIVRAAIDRCRTIDSGDFKQAIVQTQLRGQLERLDDEEQQIKQRREALKARLKGQLATR